MGLVIVVFCLSLITVNVYRMIWKYTEVPITNSQLPPYEEPPSYVP